MSHEFSEEHDRDSTTTTTTTTTGGEVEDNIHHNTTNTNNSLLQVLVNRSPLRCAACTECATHSMRDETSIHIPHIRLEGDEVDDDTPSPSECPARMKTYELQVQNLSYRILPSTFTRLFPQGLLMHRHPELLHSRYILHNITCTAKPGQVLAIVGPSGAGKSTLLEILAGRIQTRNTSILVNKLPMHSSTFRRISGYVMQHDALFPLLTVSETLTYSAQLRLPSSMPLSVKKSRVESLMLELGLQNVATSRIGSDSIRGISGGERRRVSIGVDVIHNPAVLLLDEPTSGLDSAAALQVVGMLQSMAKLHDRTIILSIHQPSLRILELINSLLLLAKGQVIHHGTVEELGEKLAAAGHNLPPHVNVVEYAIETIHLLEADDDGGGDQRQLIKVRSSLQDLFNGHVKVVQDAPAALTEELDRPTFANSSLREILLLSSRCGKIFLRTRQLATARVLQAVFVGLALGTIFLRLGHDLKGVQERYGFFAFTLTFLLTSTSEALPLFLEERQIFMRETSRGAYRVSSYVISNTLMFLPLLLVFSLLYTVPTYCLVGLNPTSSSYIYFLLIVWLTVVVANSFVAFISAIVPNYIMGNTFITGILGAFFLFSGYFITESHIPKYWLFMHYLSLFKYPLDGMLINEYESMADRCFGVEGICTVTGKDVLAQSGLENASKWRDLQVMVAFAFAYRILAYVALRYKPRHRQQ